MGKLRLQNETLVYCPETSFGQLPESPSGVRLSILSETLGVKTQNQVFQQGLLSYYHGEVVKHIQVMGEVRTYVYPNFYCDLIVAAMRGNVSTAGSGPYVHTITLAGKEYSYIFERAVEDASKYLRYYGCRIGAARIKFPTVGPVSMSFAVLGIHEKLFDIPVDTVIDEVSEEPYFAEDSLLYIADEAITSFISGDITLAVDMKVGRFSPKNQKAREIWPGVVAANGVAVIYSEDIDRMGWEADKILRDIEFRLTRGSSVYNIKFDAARITQISRPFVSVGDYAQTVEFIGAEDGSALPVEIVITNNQSSI